MKHTMRFSVGGQTVDVPNDELEQFRTAAAEHGATPDEVKSYRVDGKDVEVPDSQYEQFSAMAKERGATPQPLRRLSFADGSTRDFTMPELSKFLRSKEWREDERYAADREAFREQEAARGLPTEQGSAGWAGTKGAIAGAAQGAVAGANAAASKVLAAIPEAAASVAEAAGNALSGMGNAKNPVGEWLHNSGKGVKDWLNANVKTTAADQLGYTDDLVKLGDTAGDAAGMAVKFAPAAVAGPGYVEAILASDGINAYRDTHDAAIEKGWNEAQANVAGATAGLINYYGGKLLMKSGDVASAWTKNLLGQFLLGGGVAATTMGAQAAGNKAVENTIEGKPFFEGTGGAFAEGLTEGAAFHVLNAAGHGGKAAMEARRETALLKEMRKENLLTVAENGGGDFLDRVTRSEGMEEAVKARKEGKDVSRKMGERADLPDNMSVAERNEVVDAIVGAREEKAEAAKKRIAREEAEIAAQPGDERVAESQMKEADAAAHAERQSELQKTFDEAKPAEAPKTTEEPAPKAEEPPPQKPATEAPRSAPKEEGTTTPPKATEGAEGGKTAENGVPKAETPAEPAKTEPEAPKSTAPTPTERTASADAAAKKAKAKGFKTTSHVAYDEDGNSGSNGMVRHHHENGGRLYSLPVDVDATRANGGRVVLDKNDPAYGRLSELLGPYKGKLRLSKNGNLYFKDGKGVPKELRELLGRELKIGKNAEDPFSATRSLADERAESMSGDARMASDEPIDPGERWRKFEDLYRADKENYDKWSARRRKQEASARERAKMQKAVEDGKMSQEDFDIWQHKQDMEAYREFLEDRGVKPEKDEDFRAMERDLERMEEAASKIDYAERAAAEEGKDKAWDEAIGEIESGDYGWGPTDEYVKPFSRENLQGAKKGDIVHFDHDEKSYTLLGYDPKADRMTIEGADGRRYEVSLKDVKELNNGSKDEKIADKTDAGDAGGERREPAGTAGGEARGEEGAGGAGDEFDILKAIGNPNYITEWNRRHGVKEATDAEIRAGLRKQIVDAAQSTYDKYRNGVLKNSDAVGDNEFLRVVRDAENVEDFVKGVNGLIEKHRAVRDDWASRSYKTSRKMVEVADRSDAFTIADGETNRLSTDYINEHRRRNRVEGEEWEMARLRESLEKVLGKQTLEDLETKYLPEKPADLALESATPEQLAAEKARREQQAEIKKRQEAELHGSAGETGQTLLDLGGAEGEDLFNRTQRRDARPQMQDTPLDQRLQDPAFRRWAQKQGVAPTKDHLEMYDRQQAKGAFKVVKRWLRGVKAKFESRPPTDADIGANDRALRNVRGDIIGKWDKAKNEVTLYPGANAETVAHEIGWHATYDHAEKMAARGDRRLLEKLQQYAQNAPAAIKASVLAKYGLAADPRMLLDEVGAARFTADQAMKIKNEADRRAALKWYGKAWEACRDAYKSLLTKMGFNKTSIDAMNAMSPEQAVEFMAKEMAEGKSIGEAETKRGVDDALTLKEKYVRDLKDESQILHWADEMTGGRFNLHREQKLSHGMKQKANDKAVLFVEKLNEDMKAAGVKLSELDEYMRAKGAADTNRRIKALNGNEDGAGISDRDAATTVLQYERGPKGQAIKDLADRVWKLQKEGLMERVRAGLISAQFANDLMTDEPHHVPRHNRFDANGEFTGYESNAELAAAEWHKAEGRTTDAGNAVGWILQEYCDAFSRGADNRVRQRLAQAVLSSNGVLGKATVVTPANEARLAEKTKHNRNGNAQVVIVKQNGKKVALELNGVRGEAIASFFTGRDTKKMPGWMHKLVRIWASTKTEWSPMFAIDNFRADTLDALLLHVGDEGLIKGAKQAGQHMKNAFGLRKDIVEYVKTGETSNTLLREAIDNGILIGGIGREGFTDANEMAAYFGDKLSLYGEEGLKRMARRGRMGAKNVVRAYLGWVETVNKTAELATRLADYKVQRDAGMQPKDAAAHARDITVDFNEKGRYTDITNTLYLFSNSTMGSAFRQMKALTGKHWKSISATVLAMGFAEGLVEAFNGDEDEREKAGTGTGKDLNEFTRANSLYVRVGGTTIKTPFHAGPLSVIKYTGNCAARYMAGLLNDKNASKLSGKEAATNIGKEAAGIITHFLGLGGGGANIEQTLTPSVLQWLVQLGQNRDYADRPIQKPKYEEAMPNSANGRRSTAEPYKWFAEAMNRLGGGNEGKKGSVLGHSTDYAPEVYKIFAESFGGNVLRDITSVGQIIGTVSDAFQGKDIDAMQIPAVGRFVRRSGGNTQRYYEAANQYRENRYELRTMIPNWTAEERKAFVKEHPWAAAPEVDKMIQKIGELQKLEDGYKKADKRGKWVKAKEPPTEEQKEKWKAARLRYQAKFLEIAEKHGGEH